MKINGYTLRTAIRAREAERDGAVALLSQSLQGQVSSSPEELMLKIENCEKSIASLQAFQSRYNLEVMIAVGVESISMAEAVKRIGGIERVSAHWRNLMSQSSQVSSASVSAGKFDANIAIEKAKKAATEASSLRGRMSAANSTEIEIPDLEEKFIE